MGAVEWRRCSCEMEEVERDHGRPRATVTASSSWSDPKLLRAAGPSFLASMAGGRPLPRAAEQGPRGGAELLEDRAPPPSSSLAAAPARLRPRRRSSSSRAGEPWGVRRGRGRSAPSTSPAPPLYGARGSSVRPPRAREQTSSARQPRACVPRSSATSAVGAGKLRPAGASALRGSSALAAMGARGGQLRPGRRRCRQWQARLGRRYARGSSGRPPRVRAQASSARRLTRVRHAHRARCQVDARLAWTSEGAL